MGMVSSKLLRTCPSKLNTPACLQEQFSEVSLAMVRFWGRLLVAQPSLAKSLLWPALLSGLSSAQPVVDPQEVLAHPTLVWVVSNVGTCISSS